MSTIALIQQVMIDVDNNKNTKTNQWEESTGYQWIPEHSLTKAIKC